MYIKINALLMNILYIYERKHLYYIILFFVLAFAYVNKCEKRYTFFKLLKIFHFLSYYASRLKKAHMFQSNSLVYIYIYFKNCDGIVYNFFTIYYFIVFTAGRPSADFFTQSSPGRGEHKGGG